MNNWFLVVILVLIILSSTFLVFFFRDAVVTKENLDIDACAPVNVQTFEVTRDSFLIEWETRDKCLGLVKYGDSQEAIKYMAIGESEDLAKRKHSVEIEDLRASTIYYVIISSDGVDYGNEGSPIVVNTKAY